MTRPGDCTVCGVGLPQHAIGCPVPGVAEAIFCAAFPDAIYEVGYHPHWEKQAMAAIAQYEEWRGALA